jgi:hypothetical protein
MLTRARPKQASGGFFYFWLVPYFAGFSAPSKSSAALLMPPAMFSIT